MATGLTVDQKNILEVCARIEDTAAKTYHLLAEAHRNIAPLAALWRKTAAEEENHARQFRMNPRLLDDMVRNFTGFGLYDRQVVEQFAEFHMSTAAVFKEERHKRLFQAMMAADHGHVEELMAALKRLTDVISL